MFRFLFVQHTLCLNLFYVSLEIYQICLFQLVLVLNVQLLEQGERIHAPHVAFTGPYTVFAPSDFAFAKIGEDALNHYSSSQLSSIIKYHIVDGYILSAMAGTARNYSTLLGETVSIGLNRGVSGQVRQGLFLRYICFCDTRAMKSCLLSLCWPSKIRNTKF